VKSRTELCGPNIPARVTAHSGPSFQRNPTRTSHENLHPPESYHLIRLRSNTSPPAPWPLSTTSALPHPVGLVKPRSRVRIYSRKGPPVSLSMHLMRLDRYCITQTTHQLHGTKTLNTHENLSPVPRLRRANCLRVNASKKIFLSFCPAHAWRLALSLVTVSVALLCPSCPSCFPPSQLAASTAMRLQCADMSERENLLGSVPRTAARSSRCGPCSCRCWSTSPWKSPAGARSPREAQGSR
jgi:hypothetical protein